MTKKHDRHHQIALIVEGGGFKSGFTAGVLDSFIINRFNPFHLYLGVSGGAMNLTSYISRQYKRNINIISAMSENTNFISIVRFLKGGNYMELKYLLKLHQSNILLILMPQVNILKMLTVEWWLQTI